jgi:ALG3 protein
VHFLFLLLDALHLGNTFTVCAYSTVCLSVSLPNADMFYYPFLAYRSHVLPLSLSRFSLSFVSLVSRLSRLSYSSPVVCSQIISCVPFLLANPVGYLVGSFNFGRKFFYVWTVNWKFLPEEIFLSTRLAVVLLVAHLVVLALFAVKYWCKPTGGFTKTFSQLLILENDWESMSPHRTCVCVCVCVYVWMSV